MRKVLALPVQRLASSTLGSLRFPLAVWKLLLVACLVGADPARAERPLVLLLGLGGVRADMASDPNVAPTLGWLCSQGARFTHAYSNAPWPRAAAATLLTGSLSPIHGVRGPLDPLRASVRTLPQIAKRHGYDTVAVVSHLDVHPVFGFARGIDRYDARLSRPIVQGAGESLPVPGLFFGEFGRDRSVRKAWLEDGAHRPDSATTEAALGVLAQYRRRPLFLWVTYFGASQTAWYHEPFHFLSREDYARRVAELDREVGRLLRGIQDLGLARKVLVVVYADAGFSLLEHGEYGVGYSLYEPAVRIPLCFIWPGRIEVARESHLPVSLLDVAPTVVDLLGWPGTRDFLLGRSLAPWLLGRDTDLEPAAILLETYLSATVEASRPVSFGEHTLRVGSLLRGVRVGRYKLIERVPHPLVDTGRAEIPRALLGSLPVDRQVFDLEADPAERDNLAARSPGLLEEVERALRDAGMFQREKAN